MRKPWLALATLIALTLYTGWTMANAEQSLLAFGLQLISSPDTLQVVIDLYLMAALACLWMWRDAQRHGRLGRSVLPYCLLTLVFVSIGPLLYLVVHGFRGHRP